MVRPNLRPDFASKSTFQREAVFESSSIWEVWWALEDRIANFFLGICDLGSSPGK